MHTDSEIKSQPDVWTAALAALRTQYDSLLAFWKAGEFDSVVFTGCGSTYYLGLSAANTARQLLPVPAAAYPGSELWLNPDQCYHKAGRTLLIAVSRSAKTTETYNALQAFKASARGAAVALSCYPNPEWTALCDHSLVFPAAQEESLAQTRAFSTLHLATTVLSALFGGHTALLEAFARLPDAGRHVLANTAGLAARLGQDTRFDRFYFLGSGERYGLACELSLKMKEMSLSHSEPFYFLEFRHGPIAMANDSTLIVGLVSEDNAPRELAVLEDARALGARVLAIGERDVEVAFNSGLPAAAHNLLGLPVGQMLAFERAVSKGLNPDLPTNLRAVVEL